MESLATGAFLTVTEYLSLRDVVALAIASKALYKSVSKLPRWIDFSVPKEFLTYERPKRKIRPSKDYAKKSKKAYYSEDDDDEDDDDEERSYPSESESYSESEYDDENYSNSRKDLWVRHFRDYVEVTRVPFFRDGVLESLDFTGVDCFDGGTVYLQLFDNYQVGFIFQLLESGKFPNLNKLSIARDPKNCNYSYGSPRKAAAKRKDIKEPPLPTNPSKLTVVNISGHSTSLSDLRRLLAYCPSLKVFIAPYTCLQPVSDTHEFFSTCTQLELLDVSYSYWTSAAAKRYKKYAILYECNRDSLLVELSHLNNFKSLHIVGCEEITDQLKFRVVQHELWNPQYVKESIFEENFDLMNVPNQYQRG